jgi:hypothetical protein
MYCSSWNQREYGRIFCEEGAKAALTISATLRSEDNRELFESRNMEVAIGDLEWKLEPWYPIIEIRT